MAEGGFPPRYPVPVSEPIPPPRKPGTTWRRRVLLVGIVLAGLAAIPLAEGFATREPHYPQTVWVLKSQSSWPFPIGLRPEPSRSLGAYAAQWWPNPELLAVQLNPRWLTRRVQTLLYGWSAAAPRDYRWTKRTVVNEHGEWWEMELVDD